VRRLFWLGLGATAGVLVVRRLARTAAAFTPRGLGDSVAELGTTIRVFAEEVRAGMVERELELREALGLDDVDDATPDASAAASPARTRERDRATAARREDLIQHPFGDR
jgi:hypothetical protein